MPDLTGSTLAQFTIGISHSLLVDVTIAWNTVDGTAVAGQDYQATSGTVVIPSGETSADVGVVVYAATTGTGKTFTLQLNPPINAILNDRQTEATITLNSDGTVPSTQVIVPTGPIGLTPVLQAGTADTLAPGASVQWSIDNTDPARPIANVGIPAGATGKDGKDGQPGPAVTQGPWTQVLAYNVPSNLPALTANGGGYPSTTLLVVTTAGTMTVDDVGSLATGDFLVGGGTKWTKLTGGAAIQAATTFLVTGLLTLASGGSFGATDGSYGFSGIYLGSDGEYIAGHMPDGSVQLGGFLLTPGADGSGILSSADGLATPILKYLDGSVTLYGNPNIPGTTFSINSIPGVAWATLGVDNEYLPLLDFAGNGGIGSASDAADFSDEEIAAFDAMVLARAQLHNQNARALTQPIIDGAINSFVWYGQSLSVGTGGYPALSTTALSSGVVTCGTRLTFTSNSGVLTPVTDGAFHAMFANAAQPEIPNVCALFGLKYIDCGYQGTSVSDTTRTFVSNSAGVGGRTIELLSYNGPIDTGMTQNYFTGLENMIAAQAAAATAAGKDFYIPVFYFQQGEANYETAGAATSAAAYSALVLQLQADFMAQIVKVYCPKQVLPPLMILAQTGGIFIRDGQSLGVSTGQILAAASSPTIVCMQGAGNLQSRPDLVGHPSVNAYRLHGNMIAQILEQVLIKRMNWDYMAAKSDLTWWRGSTILVGLKPRKSPIRIALPFDGYSERTDAPSLLGYTAIDSVTGAPLTIAGVTLPAAATVQISLASTPQNPPLVSNSDLANCSGNTFIEDSDDQQPPAIGYNTYQYVAGMEDGENIPALIGTPYSMRKQSLLCQVLATKK